MSFCKGKLYSYSDGDLYTLFVYELKARYFCLYPEELITLIKSFASLLGYKVENDVYRAIEKHGKENNDSCVDDGLDLYEDGDDTNDSQLIFFSGSKEWLNS